MTARQRTNDPTVAHPGKDAAGDARRREARYDSDEGGNGSGGDAGSKGLPSGPMANVNATVVVSPRNSTSTRQSGHWYTGSGGSPATVTSPDGSSRRPHFGHATEDAIVKALSVRQPRASAIADGSKTLETRTWATAHRGPLLVCATKRPQMQGLPTGVAICIVEVTDCRPMTPADVEAAGGVPYREGLYVWELAHPEPLAEPFPVVGRLGLFTVHVPALETQTT